MAYGILSRRFVATFFGTLAISSVVIAIYFAFPQLFFFRAWEYFSLFVYEGYGARSTTFRESGDSARQYLVPRYASENRVSVNGLGNRVACFENRPDVRPRVLLIGDSQLFGSGTGDDGVFSSKLCSVFEAAIYNGARRHGLELLGHPDYRFDAILFTQTERALARGGCEWWTGGLERNLAAGRSRESFLLPDERTRRPFAAQFEVGVSHLFDVLASKLRLLEAGRWRAPERHLDVTAPHRVASTQSVANSLQCASRVEQFFAQRGIAVGFLVFPAHQTIYADELGVTLDKPTSLFIDELTSAMAAAGLRTVNSRKCLLDARKRGSVFHPHDSHLNELGYHALAECVTGSSLARLFH
jgi:hypothetical protein